MSEIGQFIVEFLLKNDYTLTALEFHQELLEKGLENPTLQEYFEKKKWLETSEKKSSELTLNLPSSEEVKKKEEQISALKYQLDLAKKELEKSNLQLKEFLSKKKQEEGEKDEKIQEYDEIHKSEKQVINYLVSKYLITNKLKRSQISFLDEIGDENINLDKIIDAEKSLDLLYLYRFFNGSAIGKQVQQDKNALREVLSKLEIKDQIIESLKASLLQNEKDFKEIYVKAEKLQKDNKLLKSEVESLKRKVAQCTPLPQEHDDEKLIPIPTPLTPLLGTLQKDNNNSPVVRLSDGSYEKEAKLLKDELKFAKDTKDELIFHLTDRLPFLIEATRSKKREHILPILIKIIQNHPDERKRDSLSRNIFSLIRKPDKNQRKMIIESCVALSRIISPDRFEKELLPQCVEQIKSKYIERRILVADACGSLGPCINAQSRVTNLLVYLFQLMDDPSDLVRAAVASNLAQLASSLTNLDKYSGIEDAFYKLLVDKSATVKKSVVEEFVPVFSDWTSKRGVLASKFVTNLLAKVQSAFEKDDLSKGPLIDALTSTISSLYNFSMNTIPEKLKDKSLKDLAILEKYIQNRDESWPIVDFLVTKIVPNFINLSCISKSEMHHEMIKLFSEICKYFGTSFTEKVIKAHAIKSLNDPSIAFMSDYSKITKDEYENKMLNARKRLLPVILIGILPYCPGKQLNEFTTDLIKDITLDQKGWSTKQFPLLEGVFALSSKYKNVQEEFLNLAQSLVSDPGNLMRLSSIRLLIVLSDSVDADVISNKILASMLKLAIDPDKDVRWSVLVRLNRLIPQITEDKDLNTLMVIFDHFFNDQNKDIYRQALEVLGSIIPIIDTKFRDNYILKKLFTIGKENNLNKDNKEKSQIAILLFNSYRATNGGRMSKKQIIQTIYPGLQMLLTDADSVQDSNLKQSVQKLMSDLERSIPELKKPSMTESFKGAVSGLTQNPTIGTEKKN